MAAFQHTAMDHLKEGWGKYKKRIAIGAGVTIIVVGVISGGIFAYAKVYENRIYPGVSIGGIDVAGLTKAQASEKLQETFDGLLNRGWYTSLLTTDGELVESVINLRTDGSTDPDLIFDYIYFDLDHDISTAFAIGRNENIGFAILEATSALLTKKALSPSLTLDESRIEAEVLKAFGEYEDIGQKTSYAISFEGEEIMVEVEEGEIGTQIDIAPAFEHLQTGFEAFSLPDYEFTLIDAHEVIQTEEALAIEEDILDALNAAPYKVVYTSQIEREYSWDIAQNDLANWLIPSRNGDDEIVLSLDEEAMEEFLAEIHEDIDEDPQNARFAIEGNKVVEFAGSLDGVEVDDEATMDAIIAGFGQEEDIELQIILTEADITTENVNDLGIKEVLGTGFSDFSGSPSNRISNILHGTSKLNGLLIAPGQEISLVEELKPFTLADGYLSELVIKGDEIIPEVGGGLCQLGTTTFRAAMNAGLQINQRRNHSLVVNYYNDPSNNNPGTDATLYDSPGGPDLKIENNYDHYILLTTEVDLDNQELYYTFWGTSDGRNGYYTPPQILSWTGYGATQYKETTDLAPGQQSCQSPHPGATASFDYIIEYEDGEVFTETYTSVYRSLPQICLVGAGGESSEEGEIVNEEETENNEADAVSEEETAPEESTSGE